MKKKLKKCENGGELAASIAPQLLGQAANLALPGSSAIVTPLLQGLIGQIQEKNAQGQILNDHFNSLNVSTNPYGNTPTFEKGGMLEGLDGILSYNGASHKAGGIGVNAQGIPSPNPIAEVEDGEVMYKVGDKIMIFSNKLKA